MAVFFKPPATESDRLGVLAGATESQLRRAIAKAECVDLYRQELVSRSDEEQEQWVHRFIEWLQWRYPHIGVSRPTLYRWAKLYTSIIDLHRLIDRRGGDNTKQEASNGTTQQA